MRNRVVLLHACGALFRVLASEQASAPLGVAMTAYATVARWWQLPANATSCAGEPAFSPVVQAHNLARTWL
jgi:hypothetical protein